MKILKNVKNNIGILVIALPFAILFIALLAIQTKSIYRGTIYDMILYKLFYTLLLLLCIALILCGILCILSFIYPTIDGIFNLNSAIDEIFNFDMLSTKERLSLGLGGICIGVKLLKWGLE